MDILTNLRQLSRTPLRTVLNLLLFFLLTAFFTVSANMFFISKENLTLAEETYSTIAIMELYADVDSKGVLQQIPGVDYAGYLPVAVSGYDISPVISASGVEKYDLRARYGAYVPNVPALIPDSISDVGTVPIYKQDIIRFTVEKDTPIGMMPVMANVTVLESTVGIYRYKEAMELRLLCYPQHYEPYSETIAALNNNTEPEPGAICTLKAGIEYIAPVRVGDTPQLSDGIFIEKAASMMPDQYGATRYINYSVENGETLFYDAAEDQPFWLLPYETVKNDASLSAYFDAAKKACSISVCSFGVMATDDVMGIPAFHLGSAFLREGRIISADEYASGKRVCLISANVAQAQGWRTGDMIDMHFYTYNGFLNERYRLSQMSPVYTQNTEGFFDNGKYEIIGIYDMRPAAGNPTVLESAFSIPWNTVLVPKQSLQNAPSEETHPVSGALLTLWIENGSIGDFLEHMDALNITAEKAGDYEGRFTFYDQGYSGIQQSLETLSGSASVLLVLSGALLSTAAVLMGFFYALSVKQTFGIMLLLGCGKVKAFFSSFFNALPLSFLGMGAGAFSGYFLTEHVGRFVVNAGNTAAEAYRAFGVYLAAGSDIALPLFLEPDAKVTLAAMFSGLILFVFTAVLFLLITLKKELRTLLSEGRE